MYYIFKLHHFVAVLSLRLLSRLFCQRFLKIKNVDKIKNVKNVKNVFTSMHTGVNVRRKTDVVVVLYVRKNFLFATGSLIEYDE